MRRADEVVARDMGMVMILYGVILQIIFLFIPGNLLKMSLGLWIGVIAGILVLVHLYNTLDEALELPAEEAARYMQKRYAVRYTSIAIGFISLTYLDVVNFITLLLGIMGLKVSAYIQPTARKLFEKFRKSK